MKGLAIVNAVLIAGNILAALVMLVLGKTLLYFAPEAGHHIWPWFLIGSAGVIVAIRTMKTILDRRPT
jgi:hypothetical protein